ncbi:MAG: ECF transporter S component [Bryobacterales bacterium]|nr:ECF transporter S component [Bryobacteraceae bacterium]MDW8354410.1 ECF transporter S component [Bryobacterales bacterium]
MRHRSLQPLVVSAVMAALALVFPVAFHLTGLGSRFLPMFLPLLLNGFLVPASWAMLTGSVTPFLSSLLTGMPPLYPPVAVTMAIEGATLGGVAALIYRGRPQRLWPALVTAVVFGRLSGLASTYVLADWFELPAGFATAAVLVRGLPGVALQMAAVPLLVRTLERRQSILFSRGLQPQA